MALKRAFDVAAVDTSKREKKKRRNMSEIMSAQIKMLSISSVIIDELVSYDESDKSEM